MSYYDLGSEPEKVYHALVLGMLVWMSGKIAIVFDGKQLWICHITENKI